MKFVFSNAAEADLEEIGDYIARDDARRAVTFMRELRGRALECFPFALAHGNHSNSLFESVIHRSGDSTCADHALDLASMPRAFPLVPRYEDRGIRRRPYGNYLIFYCIDVSQVRIIRILHGGRDYESLLFPE